MPSEQPTATMEELIEIAEKRYSAFLNSQLVGVTISDGDEHIYRINDKFLHMLGYSRSDFEEGKITWSAITPQKYDRLDKMKLGELAVYSFTETFEKEYIHKNGQSIPVVVGAELISQNPSLNISFAIDVSKQKESEKEKERVIATVGHELKTPLSVLRVQAQLLALDVAEGMSHKKILKNLKEFDVYIKEMDDILSHILMFNKPQMKAYAPPYVEFDVGSTLRRVVADFNLLTQRKIILKHVDKDCMITGNETEIREVIMNFISNALRYSADNTDVHASVTKDGHVITLSVRDWGRGINKTDQKKIFQKSYQVRHDEELSSKTSQGLGLYLCKQIIKRHGGKIEVESKLGEGSTFTCFFKAAQTEK